MSTIIVNDLTDPHSLKKEYPNVHIIQDVYKQNVEEGFYVKVRRNGFYFWVKVTNVDGTTVTGEIYYTLPDGSDFTVGDFIVFEICYAFDIYNPYTFELIPRSDQIEPT